MESADVYGQEKMYKNDIEMLRVLQSIENGFERSFSLQMWIYEFSGFAWFHWSLDKYS